MRLEEMFIKMIADDARAAMKELVEGMSASIYHTLNIPEAREELVVEEMTKTIEGCPEELIMGLILMIETISSGSDVARTMTYALVGLTGSTEAASKLLAQVEAEHRKGAPVPKSAAERAAKSQMN